MDEYEIADLADDAESSDNLLKEAREWLKACLNMVDGDGLPPNWDGIRTFLKQSE
jgi:hypothetical protein